MNKRINRLLFVLASVVFLGIYLNYDRILDAFSNRLLTVKVLTSEEIEGLQAGKEDTFLAPDILLNGGKLPYDAEQNMLLIPQALDEAYFQGVLSVKEGELYFLQDEGLKDKQSAISENKIFRLFWITDTKTWMYNVYFTGMPVMSLHTERTYETEKDGQVSEGEVRLQDPYRSGTVYQSAELAWHKRGATTLTYEKAGYRLSLQDQKLSFLGMRRDDDWILNALYDDAGLIHNKLSYDVWREIASANQVPDDEGISMEYVELFIDDEYRGVYGLLERIDEKQLHLKKGDILYKYRSQELPEDGDYYQGLPEPENAVVTIEYPGNFQNEHWDPLKDWVLLVKRELPEGLEDGYSLLNAENAVDYNLFNMLIFGMDNIMKNVYFKAELQGDGSYEMIKIPWDLNMTWGNSWVDDSNCFFNRYQEKNIRAEGGYSEDMAALLEKEPEKTAELLYRRWQELRQSVITPEKLIAMLEGELSYLHASGAYVRNSQKWPVNGDYWQEQYLYEYIGGRIAFLDGYFERLYQENVPGALE